MEAAARPARLVSVLVCRIVTVHIVTVLVWRVVTVRIVTVFAGRLVTALVLAALFYKHENSLH